MFFFFLRARGDAVSAGCSSQAMKYLSYLLYPLCVGGAIYALVFVKYKRYSAYFSIASDMLRSAKVYGDTFTTWTFTSLLFFLAWCMLKKNK